MLKGLVDKFHISPKRYGIQWGFLLVIGCLISLNSCEPKALVVSEGYFEINGSDIFYKTVGEGEPLFIVHGGPVLDHSYFLPHLESLAKDFQLVFYDQRASGRSSINIDSSKMNLNSFIEDIELLRVKLGFEKINLLGHSWGGLLAMGYGIKYSHNLDHLILSNSMAPNTVDWQTESAVVAKMQTDNDRFERKRILDALKDKSQDRLKFIEELLMASFKPQMYDRENLKKLKLYMPDDFDQRSELYQLLSPDMMNFNYDAALKKITCPTLLLYGAAEPAIMVYAREMAETIPKGELSIIKESGHFPFIEQPAAFDKIVLNFLNN